MGAVFAPTRFSLVRISVRDLVADRKSLLRNSGVGGGGENLILISAQKRVRADFREGDEDSNFFFIQFSEAGGSLNGPNLFTELPFL